MRGGPRGARGRGGRGGRGGREDFFNGPPRDFDRDYHHQPQYRGPPRDERDRFGGPVPRSNDDFYVRPQRGGRGGRDNGPDMYHHGPPPSRYNQGPFGYGPAPGRGGRYHHDEYNQFDPADNYGPNMNYGPPRHFNAPPPFRGGRGGDPRGPRNDHPDFDPRRGGPPFRGMRGDRGMRGGERGGPPRENRIPRDRPEDEDRLMDDGLRPLRGHRGRGRGMRGRGRGEFGGERGRGRGDFGGERGRGRGDFGGDRRNGEENDHPREPMVRRRARGGAGPEDHLREGEQ